MKIIWHDSDGEYFDVGTNAFRRFRNRFNLADSTVPLGSTTFQINITCSGKYLLYLNGHYIGRGPARYDRRWPQYDIYDIGNYLHTGSNTIAILCLYEGFGTGQSMVSPPGLVLELTSKENDNPEQLLLQSDESWKSSKAAAFNNDAPRINGRQGSIEIFDARLDEPGWYSPDFDDTHWSFVHVHKHALNVSHFWNLSPRDIPLLQETQKTATGIVAIGEADGHLLPTAENTSGIHKGMRRFLLQASLEPRSSLLKSISTSHSSSKAILYLYEFTKLFAGYLQLHINGKAGQIVDCIYLESLPQIREGKFNLEGIVTSENRPMDRFILGNGDNHFEVAFSWKAFRYVLLVLHPNPSTSEIKNVYVLSRRYPSTLINRFNSSDLELNKIFDICQHTARICAQDAFVDSPSREQQQWIGDGRWTALVYFYLTGDAQLYRRMLIQIGQSQDHTGMIKPRHPDDHNNIPPIPAFALSWISAFYEYFLHTGDLNLAREWWPNINQLLAYFRKHVGSNGLLSNVPGWFFIDWGHPPKIMDVRRGGFVAAINLQYIEALLFAAEISNALGQAQQSRTLHLQALELKEECRRLFWNQDLGAYVDCVTNGAQSTSVSEQTNSLALLFLHGSGPYATVNLTDHSEDYQKRVELIIQNVFSCAWKPEEDIEHSTAPVPCSPFYMIRLLQGLALHEEHQLALDILKARYRIFLQADSTTTWEKWTLYRLDDHGIQHMDSASHGWGASPILFLFKDLLGISPKDPGYKEFSFTPHLGAMTHLSGEFRILGKPVSLSIDISPSSTNLIQK
jgi:hypothetical protein